MLIKQLRQLGLDGIQGRQHGAHYNRTQIFQQLMKTYYGRFAPTPSGPLHAGSLLAALGSYLDAHAHGGHWLLRIEDIDPPRVRPGAADAQIRSLAAYGFEWDGEIVWQSQRLALYAEALNALRDHVYLCACSRKTLAAHARSGVDGPVYPGTCRHAKHPPPGAMRFIVPNTRIHFDDALQGHIGCDIARECGDFVLRRADGVVSYQLAVVVDDAAQGITHVVRGADLIASTPRQIALQAALNLPTPSYLHLPVLLDAAGDKLSKQTLAAPLDDRHPLPALLHSMRHLGFTPPEPPASLSEFWAWAHEAWQRTALPRVMALRAENHKDQGTTRIQAVVILDTHKTHPDNARPFAGEVAQTVRAADS